MGKSVKGTRTEQNLLRAFAGESQARMRYTYFAGAAKKEGYEQIAAVFLETAEQEKEHAKRFFSFLEGGMLEVCGTWPAGVIGTTAENLKASAAGENEEWSELYPAWADEAEKEGFPLIAALFRNVSKAEVEHERRYLLLLERLESDNYFGRPEEIKWYCRNCGFIHEGKEAPAKCPACAHAQAYFEQNRDNY